MWMWRKFCDLKYYHDYLVSGVHEQRCYSINMKYLKGKGYKTFPIIHDEHDRFIGGYEELKNLIESTS